MCDLKGMISCADIQDSYEWDGLQYVLLFCSDYWSFIVLQTLSNCMYDYVDMRCLSFDMTENCTYFVSIYAGYISIIPTICLFTWMISSITLLTQLRWKSSWEKAMWKWNVPISTRSTEGPVARRLQSYTRWTPSRSLYMGVIWGPYKC